MLLGWVAQAQWCCCQATAVATAWYVHACVSTPWHWFEKTGVVASCDVHILQEDHCALEKQTSSHCMPCTLPCRLTLKTLARCTACLLTSSAARSS